MLAFVGSHNLSFQTDRFSDHPFQVMRIVTQLFDVQTLQSAEQFWMANHSAFQGLINSGAKFPLRQSGKYVWIDQHRTRVMKRTNKIFASFQIDAGFPSNGGIDLGQYSGWNLYNLNPTQINRSQQAGDIANDPATQRHQNRASLRT